MSSPTQNPSSPILMPRRPAGLILSVIVLAVITCLNLLTACSFIFTAIVIHTPQTANYPAIAGVQIGMGAILLLICTFSGFTVVGLFRMKRWARWGILIFAGLLASFSTIFAIVFLAMAFITLPANPNTSSVPPVTMKIVGLATGGFFLCAALIGIWWLIYFNLRRIRTLFAGNGTVVQPFPLAENLAAQTQLPPTPIVPGPSAIEVLLNCLAILYLIGTIPLIIAISFHFPLFFLGFIFRGISASVFALVIAALNLAIGIGILHRMKLAWIGALASQGLGIVCWLPLFLPSSRPRFAVYQEEIMQRMASWIPPQPNQPLQSFQYILSAFLTFLFCGTIVWLLFRARPLFEPEDISHS